MIEIVETVQFYTVEDGDRYLLRVYDFAFARHLADRMAATYPGVEYAVYAHYERGVRQMYTKTN